MLLVARERCWTSVGMHLTTGLVTLPDYLHLPCQQPLSRTCSILLTLKVYVCVVLCVLCYAVYMCVCVVCVHVYVVVCVNICVLSSIIKLITAD